MMRENTNNLVGASMCGVGGGRGGVWGYLVATIMFLFFEKKKQHKKTQEVSIKLDLSYHVPKMSIVSYVNI
jgi:hypothetical protein